MALAKGDVQGATEIAERTDDTVLRVRIALLHGDHERARQLLFEEDLDRLWRTDMYPRQSVWRRINALLLAAEVETAGGDSDAAWEHLREALTLACELVYVPSTLEAFVVAAPLLPSDEAEVLLTVAATNPAASFDTRQRARDLMTTEPTGMNPSVLTSEEILERARSLLAS